MSKKNRKKEKSLFEMDKKGLSKELKRTLNEIETMQFSLMEADKKGKKKKHKKEINKKQYEFYTNIEGIKERQKLEQSWKKTGFLNNLIIILQQASPFIKSIGKIIATFIVAFLSIDAIKSTISPSTLNKLAKIFNLALSV